MANLGLIGGIGGGILGGLGAGLDAWLSNDRQWFGRAQQTGINEARERTEQRVADLLANPLIASATDFIQSRFSSEGLSALGEQLQKNLRVAQEARGLRRSTAGAVAEASSLAAFREQELMQLLDPALRFGTLGEDYRQRITQIETPISVAFHTGSAVPGITPPPARTPFSDLFGGIASGFAGGMAAGRSFTDAQQQESLLDEIRSMRREMAQRY